MTSDGFDLDHLERLAAAATPTPWRVDAGCVEGPAEDGFPLLAYDGREADAALIAAAVNALPLLVAEVRRLRARLTKQRRELTAALAFGHQQEAGRLSDYGMGHADNSKMEREARAARRLWRVFRGEPAFGGGETVQRDEPESYYDE